MPPLPEQATAEQVKGALNDKAENESGQSQAQQDGSRSSENYIVSQTNGTSLETFLPVKPQTSQHKFLAAGQKKSLSAGGSLFSETKDRRKFESHQRLPESIDEQENGNDTSHLPNVKVDVGSESDSSIENLFNV